VEDRHFAALGWYDGQARIGIAKDEQRVWPLLSQYGIDLANDVTYGLSRGFARGFEKDIGPANAEIVEKYLVEFVVVTGG
jgi:hypothetical protein